MKTLITALIFCGCISEHQSIHMYSSYKCLGDGLITNGTDTIQKYGYYEQFQLGDTIQ